MNKNLTFIIVLLLIVLPTYSSSDSGLEVNINNFSLQIRMFDEMFEDAYKQKNLHEDFFYVLLFFKQNYDYFSKIKDDFIIWLESSDDKIVITYENKDESIKKIRMNNLTIANILKSKYGKSFDDQRSDLSIGYSLVYDKNVKVNSEIYIGAIPGWYEHIEKNALISACFSELPNKTFFKNDSLYREDKTVIINKSNFKEYLKGDY